jgi:hypothetical protein
MIVSLNKGCSNGPLPPGGQIWTPQPVNLPRSSWVNHPRGSRLLDRVVLVRSLEAHPHLSNASSEYHHLVLLYGKRIGHLRSTERDVVAVQCCESISVDTGRTQI